MAEPPNQHVAMKSRVGLQRWSNCDQPSALPLRDAPLTAGDGLQAPQGHHGVTSQDAQGLEQSFDGYDAAQTKHAMAVGESSWQK